MPKDLKLRIKIKALPEDVYAALTNPFAIELWTGYPAVMDTTPGSPFELFDGDIAGHNIAFSENARIDQEWYFGDNEVPSIVTLKIFPNGASATQLDVMHTNIHSPQVHAMTGYGVEVPEYHGSDPLAATRRAIVRAVAEIGKAQSAARIGRQMK